MGLLYFAGTSCIMVMLLVTLLQLRQTDRYAGIHQASLRLARRCLVLMWLLLGRCCCLHCAMFGGPILTGRA